MKAVKSEVITLDGPAKCGKTTIMKAITRHSGALRDYGQRVAALMVEELGHPRDHKAVQGVLEFSNSARFDRVVQISAGNYYRAAAGYVINLERQGKTKDHFAPADAGVIHDMIASEEGREMLQTDPTIGQRVSTIAKYSGAQALCGALFAKSVQEAYWSENGANLVLADARDPVGHLQRNGHLGMGPEQIHPASIVPIYVDTSPEIAAQRTDGDYAENLRVVLRRRHEDCTRPELPVIPPSSNEVITDMQSYIQQFNNADRTEVALPYWLDNGEASSLEDIEYISHLMANVASDAGMIRHSYASSVS